MAVRKTSKRQQKGTAGRKRRATSAFWSVRRLVPQFWGRRWLAPGLLATGVAIGIGIGLGLASLPPASPPPASLPGPVAMDVPAEESPVEPVAKQQMQVVLPKSTPTASTPTAELAASAVLPVQSQPAMVLAPAAVSSAQAAAPGTASVAPATQSAALPSPGIGSDGLPLWRRNGAAFADPGTRPMLAIVLDDVGVAPQHARAALDLPAPIVLSIMTYAEKGADFAREARRRGHEVMVHMPMQPLSASVDPGPEALLVGLPAEEIRRRVVWGLTRFDGYVGFNNHMGSRFTQDVAGMRVVLDEARARGLLFLDSKTIAGSVGDSLATDMGVAHIARDVFLDDTLTEAAIARQLAAAEAIARRRGYAVAIGHPHPATIAVLKRSLPELAARGIAVVPLTAIVKKRDGVSG